MRLGCRKVLLHVVLVVSQTVAALSAGFFTCRHNYEHTLIDELCNAGIQEAMISVPMAGVVRVADGRLLHHGEQIFDPSYAMQVLPDAHEVHGTSIRVLAEETLSVCRNDETKVRWLQNSPRGALRIHILVPDMLKGGRTPRHQRRCETIGTLVAEQLRKRFPCARKADLSHYDQSLLLLQLLLLTPETLVVSLRPCYRIGIGTWPNWHLAAGLAKVDVSDDSMPSSAYRKLYEACACMQRWPAAADQVVDLGACPGGWTKALRM